MVLELLPCLRLNNCNFFLTVLSVLYVATQRYIILASDHIFRLGYPPGSQQASSPRRWSQQRIPQLALEIKMPKIDTLDALEEHEEHEDDYQTNSN